MKKIYIAIVTLIIFYPIQSAQDTISVRFKNSTQEQVRLNIKTTEGDPYTISISPNKTSELIPVSRKNVGSTWLSLFYPYKYRYINSAYLEDLEGFGFVLQAFDPWWINDVLIALQEPTITFSIIVRNAGKKNEQYSLALPLPQNTLTVYNKRSGTIAEKNLEIYYAGTIDKNFIQPDKKPCKQLIPYETCGKIRKNFPNYSLCKNKNDDTKVPFLTKTIQCDKLPKDDPRCQEKLIPCKNMPQDEPLCESKSPEALVKFKPTEVPYVDESYPVLSLCKGKNPEDLVDPWAILKPEDKMKRVFALQPFKINIPYLYFDATILVFNYRKKFAAFVFKPGITVTMEIDNSGFKLLRSPNPNRANDKSDYWFSFFDYVTDAIKAAKDVSKLSFWIKKKQ